MPGPVTPEEAKDWIGREVGTSEWFEIDQSRINQFADTTEDHQFIHIDEQRAREETPFGSTIAHGFLTLSLLSKMGAEAGTIRIKGARMMINYGLDKVRFLSPVKTGSRVRARFELMSIDEKKPGQYLTKHRATVEIEGSEKPAMIAEWLGMAFT